MAVASNICLISSNALRFCLFSVIFGIVRNLLKFLTNLFQIVLGFENFTSLWLSFLHYEVFKVRGTFLQVPSLAAFAVSDIYSTIALLHCQYLFTFFVNLFTLTLLYFWVLSSFDSKSPVLRQLDYLTTCSYTCQLVFITKQKNIC